MTALVYPDSLPCPQRSPYQRAERRALSSIPGQRRARALWRDRLGTEPVQFFMTFEQVAIWLAWFDNEQLHGGAWFAAYWRLPSGRDGVYRFIEAPSYPEYVAPIGWRVTATLEVRGRGMAPQSAAAPEPPVPTFERVIAVAAGDPFLGFQPVMQSSDLGQTWVQNTAPMRTWASVTSDGAIRVAVASLGGGAAGEGLVLTCPAGGSTWTSRNAANANQWTGVTHAAGLFVAVAVSGSGNRVMTSPDGITWTARTTPVSSIGQDPVLRGVTYGLGLFVAVSQIVDVDGRSIITSPDGGITWTRRDGAQASSGFAAVAFDGSGRFVAVGIASSGNNASYSSNGTSWTASTPPTGNSWAGVAFGAGLFVAVAREGTGTRVATSPDGITWTARTPPAVRQWEAVTFADDGEGGGNFVAVASDGVLSSVMTSPDGINWTLRNAANAAGWTAVCSEPNL